MKPSQDSLDTTRTIDVGNTTIHYYSLNAAEDAGAGPIHALPRSLKVLFENLLRHEDGISVTRDDILGFSKCLDTNAEEREIGFYPTRIAMNDSAGLPLMADLAAMRAAMSRNGGHAMSVTPQIQSDLCVDHSVMVDAFGTPDAARKNLDMEYGRNEGRYRFLRWAQQNFDNFRTMPPGSGILHQVNVEHLGQSIWTSQHGNRTYAYPESLLGTDSHTPMVNCLGVLGWGVGGIEAGSAMLGQPISMVVPKVIGCRLSGTLQTGVTATDLVLSIVERLRGYEIIGSFVEYYGPGLSSLALSDRATLANMAPEYGATMGFFPIDGETLKYLNQTARGGNHTKLVEAYASTQGLWHDPEEQQPTFTETVEINLSEIEPCIAGPKRPQDRIRVADAKITFTESVLSECSTLPDGGAPVIGKDWSLNHGDLIIAAIASCTNTSNPSVMLAAGLVARNAVRRGLKTKPWVKTSLSPGSRIVSDYFEATGLQEPLDALGFHLTGYGCMTCMGNSGPLAPEIVEAIDGHDITAGAVLSGNRNFEGRIHTNAAVNYIGSPPLVVAYAIAGTINIDLTNDPLGIDRDGKAVYLKDIWPTDDELKELVDSVIKPERYDRLYADIFEGGERWEALDTPTGDLFEWPEDEYMKEPPFFKNLSPEIPIQADIKDARPLVILGDSITTDHISPVGAITPTSAAGQYLLAQGVSQKEFNSFASRRVNHEVMIRGAFANIRIQNEMVPEQRGGWVRHEPSGDIMPVHEAAARYDQENTPLVVIAGRDYGQGSSRDWAAKGTSLLGVRAVIAESLERIHRSNLVGLGVMPLQFAKGYSWKSLEMDGTEVIDILGITGALTPRIPLEMTITRTSGEKVNVQLICRLDTKLEVEYYRHGGILMYVLRNRLKSEDLNT